VPANYFKVRRQALKPFGIKEIIRAPKTGVRKKATTRSANKDEENEEGDLGSRGGVKKRAMEKSRAPQ